MTEFTIEALRRILAGMDAGNEADFNEVATLTLSLHAQLQQDREGREAAEWQLRQIDASIARIPALPGKNRLGDITFMLAVLKKADPRGLTAFGILTAATTHRAALQPAPQAQGDSQ